MTIYIKKEPVEFLGGGTPVQREMLARYGYTVFPGVTPITFKPRPTFVYQCGGSCQASSARMTSTTTPS